MPQDPPSTKTVTALRRRLLAWYRKHHRRLPWRADADVRRDARGRPRGSMISDVDAYHVFLSEAMLQQTQVATVVDYFHRFIEAFPTIQSLADADEQAVLRQWQGLGYYRRARNLHAAAKAIVEYHDGQPPDKADALLALPGVGRYTAGAVGSIAFGKRVPLLDGNVARVLSRCFSIREPIDSPATQKQLWSLADRLVPASRDDVNHAGDFNQGMMELGATVCRPRDPDCDGCPIAAVCQARELELVSVLPIKSARKKPLDVVYHTIGISGPGRPHRWLFEQRPDTGLWSRMWQLPTLELDAPPQAKQSASSARGNPSKTIGKRITHWISDRFGIKVDPVVEVARFKHQTTHRTVTFVVWRTTRVSGQLRAGSARWCCETDWDDLPLPKPQQKAVAQLGEYQDE